MFKLDFSGKATRSEYWAYQILCIVALFSGPVIVELFHAWLVNFAVLLLLIWAFLKIIEVTINRCRDAGISPWWTLGTISPIWFIVLPVLGCIPPDNK